MDELFNIITGVAGFFGAMAILSIVNRLNKLEADLASHKTDFSAHKTVIAEKYVPKDDYREDMMEIKESIKEVIAILHRKQDRHMFDDHGRPRYE